MICSNCGAQYSTLDTNTGYYFASTTTYSIGDYASPEAIALAGEEITHCGKCPLPNLDAAMRDGDNRATAGDEP